MNRIKNRIVNIANPQTVTEKHEEYDSRKYLNWRDDGDELSDPCINDFLKGYNIDPYEFKQWAKVKGHKLTKTAMQEIMLMKFTPEFLGDRILTLWNGADGQLQNFFEGFTLRYKNDLKLKIAEYIKSQGYTVYPVLTDDKPIYARTKDIFKKVVASKNLDNIMAFATETLRKCEGFMLFAGEIADLKESGAKVTKDDASGLLEYYKQIYPEDFAISLVNIVIDNPDKAEEKFDEFKDYDMSDESLTQIENYMSGNADPFGSNKGGASGGYDFISDMRGTDGTAPTSYEIRISKKKKLIQKANDIQSIPLSEVLDAISEASRDVSTSMDVDLEIPPVLLKTVKKHNEDEIGSEPQFFAISPINKITIYEIWKIYLNTVNKTNEAYVVLSGNCIINKYGKNEWENIKYRGFYTTENEALNEINGYLDK